MTMPSDDPEVNRKWVEDFDKELEAAHQQQKMKIGYCNCCGAEKINGVGECYTDCIWYDGPLPHDTNPH